MPMLQRRSNGSESNCVQFLEEHDFLFWQVEASRVGGWCSVNREGRPGSWILLVLMHCIHTDMDFLDCNHVDMAR